MFVTHSGRRIDSTDGAPSLEDVALGLLRQPRFGGQCQRHWSVLDHCIFAVGLYSVEMEEAGRTPDPRVQLAILMHDDHESVLGDTPTDYKVDDQRDVQCDLSDRIQHEAFSTPVYDALGDVEIIDQVKRWDLRALRAEALVVGPAAIAKMTTEQFIEDFGAPAEYRDVRMLAGLLDVGTVGDVDDFKLGPESASVFAFVTVARELAALIESNHAATATPTLDSETIPV